MTNGTKVRFGVAIAMVVALIISIFAVIQVVSEDSTYSSSVSSILFQGAGSEVNIRIDPPVANQYNCPNVIDPNYDDIWCEVEVTGVCGSANLNCDEDPECYYSPNVYYILNDYDTARCDILTQSGFTFEERYCTFGPCERQSRDWINDARNYVTTGRGCLGQMPVYSCEFRGTLTPVGGSAVQLLDFPQCSDTTLIDDYWTSAGSVVDPEPLPCTSVKTYRLEKGEFLSVPGTTMVSTLKGITSCRYQAGTCAIGATKCSADSKQLLTCVDSNLDGCGETWMPTTCGKTCQTNVGCSDLYCQGGDAECLECPSGIDACSASELNNFGCDPTNNQREKCIYQDGCYVWTTQGVTQCFAPQQCVGGECREIIVCEDLYDYCTPGDLPICIGSTEVKCAQDPNFPECYTYNLATDCSPLPCVTGKGCESPLDISTNLVDGQAFTANEDITFSVSISDGLELNRQWSVTLDNALGTEVGRLSRTGIPQTVGVNFGKQPVGDYTVNINYAVGSQQITESIDIEVVEEFQVVITTVQPQVFAGEEFTISTRAIDPSTRQGISGAQHQLLNADLAGTTLSAVYIRDGLVGEKLYDFIATSEGTLTIEVQSMVGQKTVTTEREFDIAKPQLGIDRTAIDALVADVDPSTGLIVPKSIDCQQNYKFQVTVVDQNGDPIDADVIAEYRESTKQVSPESGTGVYSTSFIPQDSGFLFITARSDPLYDPIQESFTINCIGGTVLECGDGRCDLGEADPDSPAFCEADCAVEPPTNILLIAIGILIAVAIVIGIIVFTTRRKKK